MNECARCRARSACTGGKVADLGAGNHYEPTVLTNCRQDMDIMQKEVFGPVLPVMTWSTDLDEAIEHANDSIYGLTSSIYTTNLNTALRACNELRFGETYINRENFEAMQGFHAGHGQSGIGGADGKHGLLRVHADARRLHPDLTSGGHRRGRGRAGDHPAESCYDLAGQSAGA